MGWDSDQLKRIGQADVLHITTRRSDGTLRRWTPIWVVRAGDELFIRPAFGSGSGWYRRVMQHRAAHIQAAGVEDDVTLELASDAATNAAVDEAYKAKYGNQPSSLAPMIAGTAAETTLRFIKGPV